MQFVKNGPDIPDALIHEHEEGRVVFFCGAGISYAAGLPGFKSLVDQVYEKIGEVQNAMEAQSFKRGQFDTTLDLLEIRVTKETVRESVYNSLQPKLSNPGAMDVHNALLELGRTRKGSFQLVTTNFDRIFEEVIASRDIPLPTYTAPLLPVPKENRWDGLVYLHGLLPKNPIQSEFEKLVYTSGDFGRAYLVERWAARFVSELFRNYTVCFVGYSINDPILRYMMDAIAADKNLGHLTPDVYAFASYESGKSEQMYLEEWKSKHVIPILYTVPKKSHKYLVQSLKLWSQIYRDGVSAKTQIVNVHVGSKPTQSTAEDDFVKRLLWAISDPSGIPAKAFADYKPTPSLDWLPYFESAAFNQRDLKRFGIHCNKAWDGNVEFSLLRRPSPYKFAPWMSVFDEPDRSMDAPMIQLGSWLCKNMHDPRLLHWIIKKGGRISEQMRRMFQWELERREDLEIPMQLVWRLFLSGRIRVVQGHSPDFYRCIQGLKKHGMDTIRRQQLIELFRPMFSVKQPYSFNANEIASRKHLSVFFEIEVVFNAPDIKNYINGFKELSSWRSILVDLAIEFDRQLLNAMQSWELVGKASENHDPSHWDLPSISDHWQNKIYNEWVILVQVLRDSWLVHFQEKSEAASDLLNQWLKRKYPIYRRLALFAANRDGVCENGEWVDWVLEDGKHWLWSVETQREVMRLLVEQGSRLPHAQFVRLIEAILQGPSRQMFVKDVEDSEFISIQEHSIWLRLSKLKFGGCKIPGMAESKLTNISENHPNWQLSKDPHRDEFSYWMSGTGDPDQESEAKYIVAPEEPIALAKWLLDPIEQSIYEVRDNWTERCHDNWLLAKEALEINASKGQWPIERWRTALQTWSKGQDANGPEQWNQIADLILQFPDELFIQLGGSLTWWIESNSKGLAPDNSRFIAVCRRVINLHSGTSKDELPTIQQAINEPVGKITQALLKSWFATNPSDNSGIPESIKDLFNRIAAAETHSMHSGLMILAEYLIFLFRADETWTKEHMLCHFCWADNYDKALTCWRGFLVSPRDYMPVMEILKEDFLLSLNHLFHLEDVKQSFLHFFTYLCLSPVTYFKKKSIQSTLKKLVQADLNEIAQALEQFQDAAGDQREQYFENRIMPFWKEMWPKDREKQTGEIAIQVALLCVASGAKFPDAVNGFQTWLNNTRDAFFVYHKLNDSTQCTTNPESALDLIYRVFNQKFDAHPELKSCLDQIVDAKPELTTDSRVVKIRQHLTSHGI